MLTPAEIALTREPSWIHAAKPLIACALLVSRAAPRPGAFGPVMDGGTVPAEA